jgi:hypothetical protein
VVERPTLTDTPRVFGCEFQTTLTGSPRGIKFACDPTLGFRACGLNGGASGHLPEVLHFRYDARFVLGDVDASLDTIPERRRAVRADAGDDGDAGPAASQPP